MTINGVPDTSSSSNAGASSGSRQTSGGNELTKDAFLQLLVAQIKNQDPLNPTDGVQFLTQLAQFSELEQLIGMRTSLEQLTTELTPAAGSGAQPK